MDAAPPVIRNAFVLGAGLGTRLRPLTAQAAQAAHPGREPAADHVRVRSVARERSDAIDREYALEIGRLPLRVSGACYRGTPITFRDEQPEILETAGGIWNVRDLLGAEPFFVYNGDVFSDLPLEPAIRAHFALEMK